MTGKTGRATKYSPERADAICKTLRDGNTLRVAALVNGIHYDTLNEWRKTKPDFSEAVTRAESEAEQEHVANIRLSARGGDWQASKFWLTHRRGDDWRPPTERQELTGRDGAPLVLSDEDRATQLAALLARLPAPEA